MHQHVTPLFLLTAGLAVAALAAAAPGAPPQEQAPPQEPAPEPEAGGDETQPLPSLDELLGLDKDQSAEADRRDTEEELQRELAEQRLTDAFAVAIQKMGVSADLLDVELDAGLGTQRLQEEILAKLDELIDQARKQNMMMGSASDSSGQSGQRQQRSQPSPGQNQHRGPRRAAGVGEGQAIEPPPRQSGDINTVIEETATEWGNLPPRLRDQLLQGRDEPAASMYRRLTEDYYQRLAEEG